MTAHLLVVDDSPDMVILVRAMARRAGHRLSAAGDLEEAEALRAGRPDLVLLDVNLVGASGLELLRHWQGQPAAARPPVALFCQPELTEDIAVGWALGADFLVSKALLADPGRWQERLAAVLAVAGGQPQPGCVEWEVDNVRPPQHLPSPGWTAALTRTLRSAAFRTIDGALLAVMLTRAMPRFTPPFNPHSGSLEERLRFSLSSVADLKRACASLVDQLWRLFGPEASLAGERELLAEVVPYFW